MSPLISITLPWIPSEPSEKAPKNTDRILKILNCQANKLDASRRLFQCKKETTNLSPWVLWYPIILKLGLFSKKNYKMINQGEKGCFKESDTGSDSIKDWKLFANDETESNSIPSESYYKFFLHYFYIGRKESLKNQINVRLWWMYNLELGL